MLRSGWPTQIGLHVVVILLRKVVILFCFIYLFIFKRQHSKLVEADVGGVEGGKEKD